MRWQIRHKRYGRVSGAIILDLKELKGGFPKKGTAFPHKYHYMHYYLEKKSPNTDFDIDIS